MTLLKSNFFDNLDYTNLLSKTELDFIDIVDILATEEEYDFSKEINYLQSSIDLIKIMLDKKSDKTYIKILNYSDSMGLSFEYTLLSPGEYLRDNLWNKLNTCVLTSATLQIG
jgi:Rad3-related DNA helicase